jgi:acyl carrier protein
MTESEILARLRDVFVDYFGDDEIALDRETTAAEVEGWDSLATVELAIELEDEFGVRFSTGEMSQMKDVGGLVDRIAAHLAAGGAGA